MTSYRRSLRFLALLVVLLLIVTACVRPFSQSDEEAAQATAEAEVTAQADAEDQPAEPADDDADSAEADSAETDEAVDGQDEEAATGDEGQEEADDHADEADSDSDEDQEEAGEHTEEDDSESEESGSESVDDESDDDSSEEAADEDAVTEGDSSMDADSEEAETAPESDAAESDAGETATTTEPTPLPAVHIVSKGENLFRIGLRYGLSWIPLAYYNNIPNPDLIYVGQNIYIPGGQAPPVQSKPESSSYTNYVVKHGDTLFRISLAFGVSPEEIVEANGISNPNRIYAGQVLKIPNGTP